MPPIRWNPVMIEILRITTPILDPDFGERVGPDEYEEPLEMPGQAYFYKEGSKWEYLTHGPGGDQEPSKGHILFKTTDLEEYGYTPKKGDKYTKFGPFSPEIGFRCMSVTPISPFRGGYLFLRVSLEADSKVLGSFSL